MLSIQPTLLISQIEEIDFLMKPASEEAAVGAVSVYWDIKKCPVPDGYDARRVGPRIKRFIRKLGYTGAISITAVGVLSKVPEKILEAVSSTGIILCTGPFGHQDMVGRIIQHSSGDNIMVISRPSEYAAILGDNPPCSCETCEERVDWDPTGLGLNVIYPYPDSPVSTYNAKKLWEAFLMEDPVDDDDDKFCETGEPDAIWLCCVCFHNGWLGLSGQGFANFMAHLSSTEHQLNFPDWFPEVVAVEAKVESPLDKATSIDSEADPKTTGDDDDLETTGQGREENEYMAGPFAKRQKTCSNTSGDEDDLKTSGEEPEVDEYVAVGVGSSVVPFVC